MKSLILGKISPEFIQEETLPELLVPTFERYKDKTAFIFKDKKISYAELDSWSNAIAKQLQDQGVNPATV